MIFNKKTKNNLVKTAVPGSCGEFFQGRIGNDNLLISCPINRFSTVSASIKKDFIGIKTNKKLTKSLLAVEKILKRFNQKKIGLELEFQSELLSAKGMGSSTADIAAAVSAVMILLNDKINWKLLKEILISIEPTDSTPWPGLSLFDYRQGEILQPLGLPPALDILIFSEKGIVDTIKFNKNLDSAKINYNEHENKLKESIKMIKEGVIKREAEKIGSASIISAKLHQQIYERSYLEAIISLIKKNNGVYGLNIAHSGTVFGILVNKNRNYFNLIQEINHKFKEINYLYRAEVVGGGIRIEEKK